MLSNLSEKLQKILENYSSKLDEKQFKNLVETLEYHKGGILPAKVLKKELKICNEDTNKLMIFLSSKGILKPKYKVNCENDCFTAGSKVYNHLSEVPMKVCDRCDKSCILLESISVEFEVLDDGI